MSSSSYIVRCHAGPAPRLARTLYVFVAESWTSSSPRNRAEKRVLFQLCCAAEETCVSPQSLVDYVGERLSHLCPIASSCCVFESWLDVDDDRFLAEQAAAGSCAALTDGDDGDDDGDDCCARTLRLLWNEAANEYRIVDSCDRADIEAVARAFSGDAPSGRPCFDCLDCSDCSGDLAEARRLRAAEESVGGVAVV